MSNNYFRFNQTGVSKSLQFGKTAGKISHNQGNEFIFSNPSVPVDTSINHETLILNFSKKLASAPENTIASVGYVNSLVQGMKSKGSAHFATIANVDSTLFNNPNANSLRLDAGSASVFTSIFGATSFAEVQAIAVAPDLLVPANLSGIRVLVKSQTDKTLNGLYDLVYCDKSETLLPGQGHRLMLVRNADMNTVHEAEGAYIYVSDGVNGGTGWVSSISGTESGLVPDNGLPIDGTKNITFTQFHGAGSITTAINGGLGLVNGLISIKPSNLLPFNAGGTAVLPENFSTFIFGNNADSTPQRITLKQLMSDTFNYDRSSLGPTVATANKGHIKVEDNALTAYIHTNPFMSVKALNAGGVTNASVVMTSKVDLSSIGRDFVIMGEESTGARRGGNIHLKPGVTIPGQMPGIVIVEGPGLCIPRVRSTDGAILSGIDQTGNIRIIKDEAKNKDTLQVFNGTEWTYVNGTSNAFQNEDLSAIGTATGTSATNDVGISLKVSRGKNASSVAVAPKSQVTIVPGKMDIYSDTTITNGVEDLSSPDKGELNLGAHNNVNVGGYNVSISSSLGKVKVLENTKTTDHQYETTSGVLKLESANYEGDRGGSPETVSAETGEIIIRSGYISDVLGNKANGYNYKTGDVTIATGEFGDGTDYTGMTTGSIYMRTGYTSDHGNSGDINIFTGGVLSADKQGDVNIGVGYNDDSISTGKVNIGSHNVKSVSSVDIRGTRNVDIMASSYGIYTQAPVHEKVVTVGYGLETDTTVPVNTAKLVQTPTINLRGKKFVFESSKVALSANVVSSLVGTSFDITKVESVNINKVKNINLSTDALFGSDRSIVLSTGNDEIGINKDFAYLKNTVSQSAVMTSIAGASIYSPTGGHFGVTTVEATMSNNSSGILLKVDGAGIKVIQKVASDLSFAGKFVIEDAGVAKGKYATFLEDLEIASRIAATQPERDAAKKDWNQSVPTVEYINNAVSSGIIGGRGSFIINSDVGGTDTTDGVRQWTLPLAVGFNVTKVTIDVPVTRLATELASSMMADVVDQTNHAGHLITDITFVISLSNPAGTVNRVLVPSDGFDFATKQRYVYDMEEDFIINDETVLNLTMSCTNPTEIIKMASGVKFKITIDTTK